MRHLQLKRPQLNKLQKISLYLSASVVRQRRFFSLIVLLFPVLGDSLTLFRDSFLMFSINSCTFAAELNDRVMKKVILLMLCSSLVMSSCDTYTGSGAYAGGSIGSILGSAIGGLSGGPRGSDMGTIIGMAGGAVVGAVIGSQADQAQADREAAYQQDRVERRSGYPGNLRRYPTIPRSNRSSNYGKNEVYDYSNAPVTDNPEIFDSNNGGDDRLYDFKGKDYTGDYSAQQPTTSMPTATVEELGARFSYSPTLEIVNARFVDDNEDNCLNRNETCKVIFEILNRGNKPVYDVVPTVVETTGNKHIFISPSIHVEKISPGSGVRYTAMVNADRKLKDGMARFCVSVIHEGKSISKVNEFNIPTKR